jgi:ketosteroid isomerase-like protein
MNSEQTVWGLERAYWDYVENNDLDGYRSLWHKDVLGWPSASEGPLRKESVTDWITSQTSKGLVFKVLEFAPAALQITGEVAVAHYRVKVKWLDKEGAGAEHPLRITHMWIKTGKDWQIIGGMGMPEPGTSQK